MSHTDLYKEFVPRAESLELKELGLNEPCLACHPPHKLYLYSKTRGIKNLDKINKDLICTAPTFSQAFRWFREKYELTNSITDFIDDKTGIEWDYEIAIIGTDLDEKGNYNPLVDYSTDDKTRKFKTYEDAELACLRKLIEIVKKQITL